MRIFFSSLKTRSKTPLSFPFCPSFQASETFMLKASRDSPSSEGSVKTATCTDVWSFVAFKNVSSSFFSLAERIPALSLTAPCIGGTESEKTETANTKNKTIKECLRKPALFTRIIQLPPKQLNHQLVHLDY